MVPGHICIVQVGSQVDFIEVSFVQAGFIEGSLIEVCFTPGEAGA